METTRRGPHEQMVVWRVAIELDVIVREIISAISKHEFKIISQIDSASDSIGSNFVEGYYSGSPGDYIRFCRYARRSCAELYERVSRLQTKNMITVELFHRFDDKAKKTGYLIDRLIRSLIIKNK